MMQADTHAEPSSQRTDVSFVIVTHNRRGPLATTLRHIEQLYGRPGATIRPSIFVVDNASTDGTIAMLESDFPSVHIIRNPTNNGAGARSLAFPQLVTEFVVLLDDDSYPIDDAVERSISHLNTSAQCGAVVGDVLLPDGRHEACAFPDVMLSGAVCLRTSVLHRLGGFREEFFRKAGEYDLSFRMWNAGAGVVRFEDIRYRHDKVSFGRSPALAHYMDLRNNLILVERFLPRDLRRIYRHDWLRRYARMAADAGHGDIVGDAVRDARRWAATERERGREILNPHAIETLFHFNRQREAIHRFKATHADRLSADIARVAIADCSKNLYATFRACASNELEVVTILDEHPAHSGAQYRGVPIQPTTADAVHGLDAIVVSTINPAQMPARRAFLGDRYDGPIATLWQPRTTTSSLCGEDELMREQP